MKLSNTTIDSLKNDESVTINTINEICKYLKVNVNKIMSYVDDDKYVNENYKAYYGTELPKKNKVWGKD